MSHYAMKQLKRSGNNMPNVNYELELATEIDVQSALRGHPNIVELFEVLDDKNDEKLYMIMEDCSGGQLLNFDDNTMTFTPNPKLTSEKVIPED